MTEKIHELIDTRWSPRAFSDQEIEEEKVVKLFEAASYAPSCFNEQPWRFIYATKEYAERYEQLLSCLVEFNQMWVKTAPMIILTLVSKKFAQNGKVNHHAAHDLGLAIGNMSAQATSMDLYMHQMAGFSVEKAREMFEIPDDFDVLTMIAVGYIGNPDVLPENIREMESNKRERKPLNKILFDGDWEDMK
ncbi:nitroreductase family protein [Labilibaculum sp. DW002]|uniref:Nitroreductase family protein n=1 Tax=Paralabilibaculum antarcticum TaxID=2912572 RepID=A0ABT5VP20_9BACT|nr:nitroreductase family protein [Labilibaculum sp. DW002]MDE5417173.1 nitroreductase family protein [Labilibaculum sp. DW002]